MFKDELATINICEKGTDIRDHNGKPLSKKIGNKDSLIIPRLSTYIFPAFMQAIEFSKTRISWKLRKIRGKLVTRNPVTIATKVRAIRSSALRLPADWLVGAPLILEVEEITTIGSQTELVIVFKHMVEVSLAQGPDNPHARHTKLELFSFSVLIMFKFTKVHTFYILRNPV